jgi:hypothetical protein
MTNTPLRSLTFAEAVAVENYKAAASGALASANSSADRLVTAAFTLATAYSAAIALVQPSGSPASWTVLLPLVPLAITVVLGLVAQSITVSLAATNDAATVQSNVASAVKTKRILSIIAVVVLVIGIGAAAWALYDTYGPGADEKSPTQVELLLTPVGADVVARACGTPADTLAGEVKDEDALSAKQISITVQSGACGDESMTLVLPRAAVAAASH